MYTQQKILTHVIIISPFKQVTIPYNPCGEQPGSSVAKCTLYFDAEAGIEEAIVTGKERGKEKGCTAILNLATLQWRRAKQDQRLGFLGGNLIR